MSPMITEPQDTSDAPLLTLAVVELVGGTSLPATLTQMGQMNGIEAVDFVVICKNGLPAGIDGADFPNVRFIEHGGTTIPLRRKRALLEARGSVVGVIEDTVAPSRGWIEAAVSAFSGQGQQICASWGPVDISKHLSSRARALAVVEYGRFAIDSAPEFPAASEVLPGCGFLVRRQVALDLTENHAQGIFEQQLAEALWQADCRIGFDPELSVTYHAEDEYGARLSTRLNHGRLYAGTIARDSTFARRAFGAMRSLLVPLVLAMRGLKMSRRFPPGRSRAGEVMWILLMSLFWGIGEFLGFVFGAGKTIGSWQ